MRLRNPPLTTGAHRFALISQPSLRPQQRDQKLIWAGRSEVHLTAAEKCYDDTVEAVAVDWEVPHQRIALAPGRARPAQQARDTRALAVGTYGEWL